MSERVHDQPFSKPRALLERVRGVEFTEFERPDECCGFGGTFSVTEEAVAAKIGYDKLAYIQAGSPDCIVSSDMSCLMHIEGCARRIKQDIRCLHLVEVLNGVLILEPPADPALFLRLTFPDAKTICSVVPEVAGNLRVEDLAQWSDASRIDVAVVRSPLGVAETGSVLLSEEELRVGTVGFLAHDLVVLLDPEDIVPDIHAAYRHPHFQDKAYVVLMTGPSGSADIEGKEVHPA